MSLSNLETPALLLDADRMERNIARMRSHLAKLGVAFRPHVKTCKSIDVARALALPIHHALTREDASLVADALGTALREAGGAGS